MIGKSQTIKIILSSYISILASDAIGNLIAKMPKIFVTGQSDKNFIVIKISIFVFLTLILTVRGAFNISIAEEKSGLMKIMMGVSYGVLSAALIVSTILVYVSGASLMYSENFFSQNPFDEIVEKSKLVRIMVNYYSVWFSLPVLTFLVTSLFANEQRN